MKDPQLDTRDSQLGTRHEGLADYRADRYDFPRLLYLVFQEIAVQKKHKDTGATWPEPPETLNPCT
ncbi:MAG: hypothetical protein ACRD2Y_13060 [Terriglobales bacterium]